MNLIGLKKIENRQKRLLFYVKLDKLGFKHKPSTSINGYIVISPNKEYYQIEWNQFDVFMFEGHYMYEARNESEFIKLAKQFFKIK